MKNDIKFQLIDPNIQYKGYWLSPAGKVIGIETDAFRTIWSLPTVFGLSRNNMEELYYKYDDEDNTINEIILDLLEKNWVLCLKKRKNWNLSVSFLNRRVADRIWEWVYNMLNSNLAEEDIFAQIKIHLYNENKTIKTFFSDVLTGDFVMGISSLSSKIRRFIERNMDYFLEEYINRNRRNNENSSD